MTLVQGERRAVAPPWHNEQEHQQLRYADRYQTSRAFGVGVHDRSFLAALATEEVGTPGAVPGEPLEQRA
ncbi:hypothetical protein [Nocardia salmonicida]|uniref:hypothetical protein n=1 Tax=Nocardia salmonicida TaxID=53431 RepID=UPI0037AB1886